MNADIKITVLKRLVNHDVLGDYADYTWPPCERFEEGQEFLSSSVNMPSDFCSWAWADIQKYAITLARGGNFLGVKPGVFVTCCTDGFRPVIFKLERLETDTADHED